MKSRFGNLSFFRNNAIGYKMQQMLRKGSQTEKRKEKKKTPNEINLVYQFSL